MCIDTITKFVRRVACEISVGDQVVRQQPSVLTVERAALPLPAELIDAGWTIEEEDERSLALAEIDLSKAVVSSSLREGEEYITGEEKLRREKEEDEYFIRLGFGVGVSLYQEEGQAKLRFLHDTFGVTWLEFTGTILLGPERHLPGWGLEGLHIPEDLRHFLCLARESDGSWRRYFSWLDDRRTNRKSIRVQTGKPLH